jgi:DNA-binding CsgD family transcriptional regulator
VAVETDGGDTAILSFSVPHGSPAPAFSSAEAEVLICILQGHTNAAIAGLRGTSPRTVANQVASIFRKVGVSSRLELMTKTLLFGEPPAEP